MHRVDDRAGAEEQQRLEESVIEQMEHPRCVAVRFGIRVTAGVRERPRPGAEREEHVAQLRNGRIREHALDIIHHQRHAGSDERREAARDSNVERRVGRMDNQRIRPRDEENARLDHRCGVNQRADRRRTFHRVGQPEVQRELRRLANRAAEEAERGPLQFGGVLCEHCGIGEELAITQRPEGVEEDYQPEQQEDITDTRDEERFLGGRGSRRLLIPETNEQVGAEANQLPEDEEQQEAVGNHEAVHHPHEEADFGVVADAPFAFVSHVAHGKHDDQERNDADHNQ